MEWYAIMSEEDMYISQDEEEDGSILFGNSIGLT